MLHRTRTTKHASASKKSPHRDPSGSNGKEARDDNEAPVECDDDLRSDNGLDGSSPSKSKKYQQRPIRNNLLKWLMMSIFAAVVLLPSHFFQSPPSIPRTIDDASSSYIRPLHDDVNSGAKTVGKNDETSVKPQLIRSQALPKHRKTIQWFNSSYISRPDFFFQPLGFNPWSPFFGSEQSYS